MLEVIDNGKGLDVERVRRAPGLGITSMAERVEVLGGSFSIQSRSDAGTVVRASVRIASEATPLNSGGSIEAALR
jgi:signal transduction histidine kinase